MKEAFVPYTGKRSLLLIDAWGGHCDEAVKECTPPGKEITAEVIPKGTTSKIQPLDVFGFRIWKNYVRRFSDIVFLNNEDINLHHRNNIIRLQSLVHNQFSAPRYKDLFKYSWFKSGYLIERPQQFENPVQFAFSDSSSATCEIDGCKNIAVVRCSWCRKSLCLHHFFHDYHFHSQSEVDEHANP